jgi:hypothetical protein
MTKERMDIYPSVGLREALDRWRVKQAGIPSRAEAARRLLEWALEKQIRQEEPESTPRREEAS